MIALNLRFISELMPTTHKNLSVVQILPELNAGGVERGTVDFARYLVNHGHQSHVISAGGRLVSQLESEGSQHLQYPVHKKSLSSLLRVRGLRKLLAELKPDVIHVRSRIPAWMTWLAVKNLPNRPRLVSTFHGTYSVSRYSEIMGCGDQVIAISETVKDYIVSNYPRIHRDKIQLIHRGVDTEEFNPSFEPSEKWAAEFFSQYPQLINKRLLMMPGRLSSWKGQSEFIELMSELSEDETIHGIIVGDITPGKEAYGDELRAKVRGLGIEDRLTFLGHRSDMRELYSISTAVFNLSQKPEPFGRTVIEALAMGKPVVAWAEGGPKEVLSQCYPEGLVVKGDMRALSGSVRTLLAGAAQVSLANEFTQECQASATLACYFRAIDAVSA